MFRITGWDFEAVPNPIPEQVGCLVSRGRNLLVIDTGVERRGAGMRYERTGKTRLRETA